MLRQNKDFFDDSWHIAQALAGRGYAIVLQYRTSAGEAAQAVADFQARGIPAVGLQANLVDDQAVASLIRDTLARFGRLDVLINCASIWARKPFEEVIAQDVRDSFEANVLSTFLCSQRAGLAMVGQADGGCIVNFGDWAEIRPYRDYAAYFASKGAIPALTRCLAVELGTRNPRVRVNCILPGPVLFPVDLPDSPRIHPSVSGRTC